MFNTYNPTGMSDTIIEVTLAVESVNGVLLAHLLFFNKGNKKFYLDKFSLCSGGEIARNVFTITDDRSRNIEYIGRVPPRKPKPEDFLYIDSGESVNTKVVLNTAYRVKKGRKYHVQYALYNLDYLRIQEIGELQSNKVTVVYPYMTIGNDRLL